MAIIFNLKAGTARSTKRVLPSVFGNRTTGRKRYRVIGDSHESISCDSSICHGSISSGKDRNDACVFKIQCDPTEVE